MLGFLAALPTPMTQARGQRRAMGGSLSPVGSRGKPASGLLKKPEPLKPPGKGPLSPLTSAVLIPPGTATVGGSSLSVSAGDRIPSSGQKIQQPNWLCLRRHSISDEIRFCYESMVEMHCSLDSYMVLMALEAELPHCPYLLSLYITQQRREKPDLNSFRAGILLPPSRAPSLLGFGSEGVVEVDRSNCHGVLVASLSGNQGPVLVLRKNICCVGLRQWYAPLSVPSGSEALRGVIEVFPSRNPRTLWIYILLLLFMISL